MNLLIPKHPTKATNQLSYSIHLSDHLVDKILSVTVITTLNEVIRFDSHTTSWTTQLEGPQEVGSLLEVFSYGENLVDQILNADDSARSQNLLDHLVVGDWDPLVVHLSKTTFVDELTDGFEIGISPRDERFDQPQHVQGGLVQLHKHSIVDLSQSKQLQCLLHLRGDLIHTTNTDHESKFCFGGNVEVAVTFSHSTETDLVTFFGVVFFGVHLGFLEDHLSLLLEGLLSLYCGNCTSRLHSLNVLLSLQ